MKSLALTCKLFYGVAALVLGDWLNIKDLAVLDFPEQLQRSAISGAVGRVIPRAVHLVLDYVPIRGDIDLAQSPSLVDVRYLMLSKHGSHDHDTMPLYELLDALSTVVGPQLDEAHIIPSQHAWTFEDVVTLTASFPRLRTLQITDLRRPKRSKRSRPTPNSTSHTVDTGTDETPPQLQISSLEWLGLGDMAYASIEPENHADRRFEPVINDLLKNVRQRLKRIDILEYVGSLDKLFTAYDGVLHVVCFSLVAFTLYGDPLSACQSLKTLHIFVDQYTARFRLSHVSLTSISFILPATLWRAASACDAAPGILNDVAMSLMSSHVPSMRIVHILSESPLPSSILYNFRTILVAHAISFTYTEHYC